MPAVLELVPLVADKLDQDAGSAIQLRAMVMTNLKILAASFGAIFILGAGQLTCAADTFPDRPIHLIVGFGAGTSADVPVRAVAEKLGQVLGQPVVIVNKTGSGGLVATRYLISRPADGYTLLECTHFE
jgi:tripartite-type tricarboxylate transporter receptor subunit TctC